MRLRLLAFALLLSGLVLPIAAKNPDIHPQLAQKHYQRVGLLVVRVGNLSSIYPAEISLKTDYSVRTPKLLKTDVYGEDESILQSAIPSWPAYEPSRMPISRDAYFRNVTQPLRTAIQKVIEAKGSRVVDVHQLGAAWPSDLAKMKMADIVAQLKNSCDALLVLHYMDRGDSYYNAVNVQRAWRGFSGLGITWALFDVSTGERMLHYCDYLEVIEAMANDPAIQNDPQMKQKVSIVDSRGTALKIFEGARADRILGYSFSDDEVVARVAMYVCQGIKNPREPRKVSLTGKWKGIAELLP